jgi:NADH:ubiquinone reductase (H+-translocating)
VALVCGRILGSSLSKRGRRSVAKRPRKLGAVALETAALGRVHSDTVVLTDGAVLPSAVTIWTTGFGVPDLATRSGHRIDALGRLLTDETLTSLANERVVAAGDAAKPPGPWRRRPPTRCSAASPDARPRC